MSKKLICYFSASGVTRKVSEKLASLVGGDLFEIKPVKAYSSEDLDWEDKNSRSSLEMTDSKSRPEIENIIDIEDYDTILIGYPIWWGLAPRVINTFIEKVTLDNKKVYLFATSGGSGIEYSVDALKKEYPNINFISGKRLSSNITSDEISAWLGE